MNEQDRGFYQSATRENFPPMTIENLDTAQKNIRNMSAIGFEVWARTAMRHFISEVSRLNLESHHDGVTIEQLNKDKSVLQREINRLNEQIRTSPQNYVYNSIGRDHMTVMAANAQKLNDEVRRHETEAKKKAAALEQERVEHKETKRLLSDVRRNLHALQRKYEGPRRTPEQEAVDVWRWRAQVADLTRVNDSLRKTNVALQEEIQSMKNTPVVAERIRLEEIIEKKSAQINSLNASCRLAMNTADQRTFDLKESDMKRRQAEATVAQLTKDIQAIRKQRTPEECATKATDKTPPWRIAPTY